MIGGSTISREVEANRLGEDLYWYSPEKRSGYIHKDVSKP